MTAQSEEKQKVGDSPFCKRFDQFLTANKKNSNRLATELGESNPVKYRRWLAGEATPSAKKLQPLADKYGLNINWLLNGEGEMLIKATPAKPPVDPQSARGLSLDDFPEMVELIQLRAEKAQFIERIETLERQLTEAKQEKRDNDREWRDWAKEGFCESDSHNHRFGQLIRESYRVEGLVRYDVKGGGKVIALNAEPKTFVLDSLRYRQPVRLSA